MKESSHFVAITAFCHKNPARNYMFKVNTRNTRTRCEICSKLTIKTLKTPERCYWCCSGVIVVNFEHIPHLVLAFLLLTLSRWMSAGKPDLFCNKLFLMLYVPMSLSPVFRKGCIHTRWELQSNLELSEVFVVWQNFNF